MVRVPLRYCGRAVVLLPTMPRPRIFVLLFLQSLVTLGSSPKKVAPAAASVDYVDDGNEPPKNPFLANSPWPMTHRNPYCQGSSPYAGPQNGDELTTDFVLSIAGSSTMCYTSANSEGDRALLQNTPFYVAKIDTRNNKLRMIDLLGASFSFSETLSVAYYFVDRDDVLFTQDYRSLVSYKNEIEGDIFSGLKVKAALELPGSAFRSDGDTLVGFNIMYDGYVVFTTSQGMVGVVQRNLDVSSLQAIQLSDDEDEEISNMQAVDENGGIYIVSNKRMYRAQWDGTVLGIAWAANYETGPETQVAGRLGAGSGSTPSLMGVGEKQDKFVVITDGSPLMNLVLFWRDEIPADWEPIAPSKDRRIAAEVPITFGDPNALTSVSEQSVLVRGYGAVVVNNDYGYSVPTWFPEIARQLMIAFSGLPWFAPYGVEKFEWDPDTRTLNTSWSTKKISCPNGIPTMSVASNLFYCVGKRLLGWNVEALDWDTGKSSFYHRTGIWPWFNSGYAGLEIGPNRELVSGTLMGVLRVRLRSDS